MNMGISQHEIPYKNQIDYMLFPAKLEKVKNIDVISNFNFGFDHRTIKCEILLNKWFYKFKTESNFGGTNARLTKDSDYKN